MLAERGGPPITGQSPRADTPCSSEQRRIWLSEQIDAAAVTMPNATIGLRLFGYLDIPALEQALNAVVDRHEALRTVFRFESDGPYQNVLTVLPVQLRLINLTDIERARAEQQAAAIAADTAAMRFDLATGPLVAATVVRFDAREHTLLVAGHHIAFDEHSIGIVLRDLAAAYAAATDGRHWAPPPLPYQYRDYAAWSARRLPQALRARRLRYWRTRLAEPLGSLSLLPAGTGGGAVDAADGGGTASVRTALPAGTLDRLRAAGGGTPFVTLLAVFKLLLAEMTGEQDVTVGTIYSGRERSEFLPVVGCFLNPLALRTDLAGATTFGEVLGRVRRTVAGAVANILPFDEIVADLRPPRLRGRHPLFQVTLNVHQPVTDFGTWPGLQVEVWEHEVGADTLDLAVEATATPDGGAQLTFRYPAGQLAPGSVERLAARFVALAAELAASPDRLPATGRIAAVTAPSGPQAEPALVPGMISAVAASTPGAVAVRHHDTEVTYAELVRRATALAGRLRSRGVTRDTVVAVCLPRSPDLVVTLLAIWWAGGAYLPLRPEDPASRRAEICADARVRHLVTGDDELAVAGMEVIRPETSAPVGDEPAGEPPAIHPEDLAYVIFTSGSTGRPKGVAVPHRALAARVRWMADRYRLCAADQVLQFATIGFDTHVEEVYPTLVSGATLVMPPGTSASLPDFLATPSGAALTVLDLPTSYWHELVAADETVAWPAGMRLMILGGEQARQDAVARWRHRFGDRVALVNTYGPTEATVIATAAWLGAGDATARPPIGRPIAETAAYVLDQRLRPVPAGAPGELYLTGAGLARGYLGRPGLTAQRFLPDPSGAPGDRMYRTGDRVRLRPDGMLEFLGRCDTQIKIRGYRIEPGEIEARLAQHPLVQQAVVVAIGEPGDQRLAAYLVPAGTGSVAADAIVAQVRADLVDILPEHMVPTAFGVVDRIPLNVNGKLDLAALPAPTRTGTQSAGYTAPRSDGERLVAEVFAEILGVEQTGVHDDFFHLGGNSLHAVRVIGRVREATDLDVPVSTLLEHRTVATFTAALEQLLAAEPAQ